MGARERGFTLLELVVAVGALSILLAAGAWAFSLHPNALAAGANDVDAALATARAVAASSGNGATVVFSPRRSSSGALVAGFSLRVFAGRPDGLGSVTPASTMPVLSDASIRERTLGTVPFALFIDSAGNASGTANYPQLDADGTPTFTVLSQEPPCPTGGFTLVLTSPSSGATQTRALSCRSTLNAPAPLNASPTPNAPIVTPSALLFHWPTDAQQQFVATEWGYTHWFEASAGFACGNTVAAFPDVLPSPYSAAYSAAEAALAPSPAPGVPYSYPNSNGASMNDAPAAFPLQPQSAGLCTAAVQDEYGQNASAAIAVMGWLTATYGSAAATHVSGTLAIPPSALPNAGSSVTIALGKAYDANALQPQVVFTGANATACSTDLSVSIASGATPSTPSPTPATAGITLTVAALPPSALSCGGIIYNHYADPTAPSDAVAEVGEGVPFTASLSPPTGPLTTLGKIVFWLPSGNGGTCSYAQLYLENGNADANAPNSNDTFNHTDANGCVTNNTVDLWATEQNYTGQFSLALQTCNTLLRASAGAWNPGQYITLAADDTASACQFYVQSNDQTLQNGSARSVSALINSCSGSSFVVTTGSGCEFTMPVSWGGPLDCTPDGSGGTEVDVSVTQSPDPMLGTLSLVSSNGTQGTYLWTRTSPGTQTISYVAVETICTPPHGTHNSTSHGSFTFN